MALAGEEMTSQYYPEEDVIEYWDKRYKEWEATKTEYEIGELFRSKDAWFEERFAHILPNKYLGNAVLDFGCGNSMYSPALLRRYDKYVGVDTSPTAIQIAHKYFGDQKLYHDWSVFRMPAWPNLITLPFRGGTFDLVFSITVLQHLPAEWRIEAIQELKRVLRPEGRVVCLEYIGDTQAYDMPNFPIELWKSTWEPYKMVLDVPEAHPEWASDNVWNSV